MTFEYMKEQLFQETDASGVSLGASLLQVRETKCSFQGAKHPSM